MALEREAERNESRAVEHDFAACHARLYEKFKRYTWAELRDADAAEEVVQSTLVAIWQRHFLGSGSRYVEVDPLAFRMLKLRVSNHLRDRTRSFGLPIPLSVWGARARRWVLRRALRRPHGLGDVVDAALDAMRPRCREVFLLRREAAMSYKEIASLCGTGPRSVSALMHRAQCVLRDHIDRAGFGTAARRRAVDTARWKIAEFNREPDLYESQEAIIERDSNPDSALLSDYIAGELSAESMADVAARLERDPEFRDFAEPLLMAWSVPPRSKPVTPEELVRSWHQVRLRAGLPAISGYSTSGESRPAESPLQREVMMLVSSMVSAFRADPASVAAFFTGDAGITRDGQRHVGRQQVDQYWREAATFADMQLEVLEVGGDGPTPWLRGRSTMHERNGTASTSEFVALLKRDDNGKLKFYVGIFITIPR